MPKYRLKYISKPKGQTNNVKVSEIINANDLSHALAIGINKAKEFNRILRRVEQIE